MSGPRCHLASLLTIRSLLDEVIESMRKEWPQQRSATETAAIYKMTEEQQIREWGT